MGNNTTRSKRTRSEDDGDVVAHRRNSGNKIENAAETKQQHLPGFIPSATNSRKSTPYHAEKQETHKEIIKGIPRQTIFCSSPFRPHILPPVEAVFPRKDEYNEGKNEEIFLKPDQNSPPVSPNLQEHIREIRSIVSMDLEQVDEVRETRSYGKSSGQVSKSAVERRSIEQDVMPTMPQRAAVSERILSVHMQEELERPRAPQIPPPNRRRSSLRSGIYSNRIHNSQNSSSNNNLREKGPIVKKEEDNWNYHTPKIEGFDIHKFKEVNSQQKVQTVTKEHNNVLKSNTIDFDNSDMDSPVNRKPLINGFLKSRSNSTSNGTVNPLAYDITEEELIASIEKEFDV